MLEDTNEGVGLLAALLLELKVHFFPYLDETRRLLIPLIGFMDHPEVSDWCLEDKLFARLPIPLLCLQIRVNAIGALPDLMECAVQAQQV